MLNPYNLSFKLSFVDLRRNTFCVFFPKEVISNRIKLFPDCTEEEWKKVENDKLAPSTSIFLIFVCNDAGDDDNNENRDARLWL